MRTSTKLLSQMPTAHLERELLLARVDLERHYKLTSRMLALVEEVIPSNPLDLKEAERSTQNLEAFNICHKNYLDKLIYVMELKNELLRRKYALAKAQLTETLVDLFKGVILAERQAEFRKDIETRLFSTDSKN
jgi:hypothetical protein